MRTFGLIREERDEQNLYVFMYMLMGADYMTIHNIGDE